MSAIKPDAVTHVEPLDRPAQVQLSQLQEEVIMIIHQDKGVQPNSKARHRFRQHLAEMLPVPIIAVNIVPFITACRDVVPPFYPLDPQWSGHSSYSTRSRNHASIVECRDVTPLLIA
jgi:hypothetical protein